MCVNNGITIGPIHSIFVERYIAIWWWLCSNLHDAPVSFFSNNLSVQHKKNHHYCSQFLTLVTAIKLINISLGNWQPLHLIKFICILYICWIYLSPIWSEVATSSIIIYYVSFYLTFMPLYVILLLLIDVCPHFFYVWLVGQIWQILWYCETLTIKGYQE